MNLFTSEEGICMNGFMITMLTKLRTPEAFFSSQGGRLKGMEVFFGLSLSYLPFSLFFFHPVE